MTNNAIVALLEQADIRTQTMQTKPGQPALVMTAGAVSVEKIACLLALAHAPGFTIPDRPAGWFEVIEPVEQWTPITEPGQVKVGDKLRFTIGDDEYNETVKQLLNPGSSKEEIIYNKKKNYYLITSMAIENTGSQKSVRFMRPTGSGK